MQTHSPGRSFALILTIPWPFPGRKLALILSIVSALGILGFFPVCEAQAHTHISLFFVPVYNLPNPGDLNVGGLTTSGYGAALEWEFSRRSGVEVGLFNMPQLLNQTTSNDLVVPLGIRYWLTRFFTISGGTYLDYQLTNLPTFTNATSFGLRATAGMNFPLSRKISFVFEMGYQHGMSNLSQVSGATFTKDQGFALIGLRFGGVRRVSAYTSDGTKYFMDDYPDSEEPEKPSPPPYPYLD